MKVFLTGGTGYVGSAILQELLAHGHQVVGLARSDTSASTLLSQGAELIQSDLENLEALKRGASTCDAVAHVGFVRDFQDIQKTCEIDRRAIEAMIEVMHGTNKPFIATFGTLFLPNDHVATETDKQPQFPPFGLRVATQDYVTEQAKNDVAAMAVRLAPTVHGTSGGGFIPAMIGFARKNQRSPYIGDGNNVWPSVHRKDVARLYRLALEKPIPGAVLHATDEQGISLKEIATTIGKQLDLPVVSLQPGDGATTHFGFLSRLVQVHNPTSSEVTKGSFGWKPVEIGLIEDLEQGAYFVQK